MLELNYTLYTSFPLILWDYRIIVASFRYCHFSHPVGTNINQVIIALSIPYHNWFPRLTQLLSPLMKTLSYTNIYMYLSLHPTRKHRSNDSMSKPQLFPFESFPKVFHEFINTPRSLSFFIIPPPPVFSSEISSTTEGRKRGARRTLQTPRGGSLHEEGPGRLIRRGTRC